MIFSYLHYYLLIVISVSLNITNLNKCIKNIHTNYLQVHNYLKSICYRNIMVGNWLCYSIYSIFDDKLKEFKRI